MAETVPVPLPQMGESVVEGTLERWCVAAGDPVERDQVICEVTTDKVDVEIPAPASGVLVRILVPEGQTIPVGTDLALIEPGASAPAGREPTDADTAPRPSEGERPSAPVRASPLARRIARERGIDLETVVGSGPGGRVTTEDLLGGPHPRGETRAVEGPVAPGGPPAPPGTLGEFLGRMRIPVHRPQEGDRVIPFSAIRRRVAEHMVVSKIVSPHVGTVAEVDLERLVRLRESRKAGFRQEHGFSLTYLPFVVQAAVRGLKEVPRMNATVIGSSIVERGGVHIGVAVETDRGLLVPVIPDADRLSVIGIAEAIEDLSRRARSREIGADELHGGTFTVTNPGREGNLYGFAVINQPQVGILRMGEIRKRPVVVDRAGEDALVIHPVMYLALSYDHRIIDGVTGNGFLFHVARTLEAAEFEV